MKLFFLILVLFLSFFQLQGQFYGGMASKKLHIPVMPSKDFENPLGLTLQTNAVFGGPDPNTQCIQNNKLSFQFCGIKRSCNSCSLTSYCGWCAKSLECFPISSNTGEPLCRGLCDGGIIKIQECAKNGIQRFSERISSNVNYKKPQFQPTQIEQKYHYGFNNKVFIDTFDQDRVEALGLSKFRFKQKENESNQIDISVNQQLKDAKKSIEEFISQI